MRVPTSYGRRVDISRADERALAVALFKGVWDLLADDRRTTADDDRMLHMAHASRYHWGQVGADVKLVRGEWLCSRVYAMLRRSEPALHHARRALELCEAGGIGGLDRAFCHEAAARGWAVGGNDAERDRSLEQARNAAGDITDPQERRLVLRDLASVLTM